MKKILFAVMAVFAIGFTSCGNKTQAPADEVDSAAIVDSLAEEAANLSISALSEQIEAGDASKLQAVLETVKVKKENADKVKALVGDNAAVAAAVSAITDIEPENVVSGFLQSVGDAAEAAKDSVVGAVENAKDAAVDAAKEKANEAIDGAADKTKEALGL